MTAVALVASPLLGPQSWNSVATVLHERGHRTVVVAHRGPPPDAAQSVIDAIVSGLAENEDWVLVPHSNAGLFAPAVSRRRRVAGIVYVDARLPTAGRQPMSSPDSLAFKAAKADAFGVLPPWNLWWEQGADQLFPDGETQRACEAEMRRLPLRYFEDDVDGTGWDSLPSAYIAFGDAYAEERQRAVTAGWPVTTMAGAGHLHMLCDPSAVADQIEAVIPAMTSSVSQGSAGAAD